MYKSRPALKHLVTGVALPASDQLTRPSIKDLVEAKLKPGLVRLSDVRSTLVRISE